ncbi:dihydroxyacetone kinase subunit DhaK [Candidatus Pelagibacter sp.]|jgi:dihydroxyacetone kinase-like protein|nr:dihydroxyacetone kinase subunit DhaK [Candidatus Pelagibacter sp.]
MKKIINNPSDFVEESIQGLVVSHPDIYSFATDNQRVIKRTFKAKNKVGIVSGGGSGHLPVFTGYVGKGMLDACAVGSVFASPSVDQIASAIRNGDNGNGVLCVLGNYGGDVMNFEMACEIVKDEGIETKTIIVSDDIASASSEEKFKRRGIAGLILAFKIAGATAENGASLEEVFNITSNANSNLRTIGVAVSSCILPEVGKPTFNLDNDEIEIGMGIHGEPGIKREKLKKADILVDDLCEIIFKDFELLSKDKVSIMINSLGATPLEELYIVSKRVNEIFSKLEIDIVKSYVGRYATSLEMAGMSITVLKLNDDLSKALLDHSECPFWIN